MRQDAGIHHQQFGGGPWLAPQHDPTEAYLGIDGEHDFRQLCLTDTMVEFRAQLLELGRFFFRSQGRQMQLIVNPEFTGRGPPWQQRRPQLARVQRVARETGWDLAAATGADSSRAAVAATARLE